MKKILFTAAIAWVTGLLLPTPPVAAQAPTFDRALPCASGQDPYGWGPKRVVVDPQGNIFTAGTFSGLVTLGSTTLTAAGVPPRPSPGPRSPADVFVAKLDAAGNYLWAVRAGGDLYDELTGLAVDATGDVVITGYFDSYRMNFGPGVSELFNSSARTEIYVAKYSGQTGRCLWAKRAGGGNDDFSAAVVTNALGEVYITGNSISQSLDFSLFTLNNAQYGDSFIAKLAANGSWLWGRHAGNGKPTIDNLVVDNAGLLYLSGTFGAPSVTFGNTILTTSVVTGSPNVTGSDLFIAKYDDSGNWIWAVQGAPNGQNLVDGFGRSGLCHDGNRSLYVCGSYRNLSLRLGTFILPNFSTMYPPSTGTPVPYTNNYAGDAFVARLDAFTGTWQWAVRTGGTQEDDLGTLVADNQGRVYAAAGRNTIHSFASPFAGGGRSQLAQLDGVTGVWRWALPVDSVVVRGLALDATGRVWTAGYFDRARAAFGPVVVPQAGAGLETGFLARLGAGPLPLATAPPAAGPVGLSVWPNPGGREAVWVEGPAPGQVVAVYDVLGRRVGGAIMPASGRLRLAFGAPLQAGVYVVRGGGQARRLVVE